MNKKAFIAILSGSLIAGTSGLIIKNIHLPGASLTFLRLAIPSIILGVWMLSKKLVFLRGPYKQLLWASIFNAIRMYLFILAYQLTSISNAVIMLFTWPIFVNILSAIVLKESISKRQIALLCLAFAGIIVIFSGQGISTENQHFLGMLAALFSAFFFSLSYVIFKKTIHIYHRNEIIFYQNILGAIIFLPMFMYLGEWPIVEEWPLITIYGVVMGMVIFTLFLYGLKYMDASKASVLQYTEIVSAVFIGVFFLDETFTLTIMIGALMILGAVTLLRRS